MVLALIALVVMLMGTLLLVAFRRSVAELLEKWAREATRAAASWKGGPA